ncbi:short-chain dehydrogenase [Aspergillus campestris IBT 28561]|uniref:Short-chain dehydrogenase n=1 Tax=Aspergillus campestris (strain IBT 28561) TaxID=1392248 RepID=A0A2I1D200_ASPC2|nr:short-chain dehydrogenase [Aspergillus campestris IBT 28561]PKY03901.1 short-chain dehydrogenase [Aspergillus campestris IBT 28561]
MSSPLPPTTDQCHPPQTLRHGRSLQQLLESHFSLQGRTIILTGGARGIGLQLLQAIIAAGADVACLDLLPGPPTEALEQLKSQCGADSSVISFHQCDVTDEIAVQSAVRQIQQQAVAQRRPIRGLVNCAGTQIAGEALSLPGGDFRRVVDVNLTGSFFVARCVADVLRETGQSGSLVLVGSIAGHAANRGIWNSNYNASKAAVIQLTRSLALEWGQYNIRVNSLSPGFIRTAMTNELLVERPEFHDLWMAGAMLGRLGEVDDLEAAVLFLLGDGARWMTGADLRVDGGNNAAM